MEKCNICDKNCNNRKSLGIHYKVHRDYIKEMEKLSKEIYSKNKNLKETYDELVKNYNLPFNMSFVRKCLNEDIKNYVCPVCQFGTMTNQARHQHIFKFSKYDKEHEKLLDSQKKLIENNYENLENLLKNKDYLLDIHYAEMYLRETDLFKFNCPSCNLNFKDKFSLTVHLKNFSSEGKKDNIHENLIREELIKIDVFIENGLKYEQLKEKSILPDKFIIDYFRKKESTIKCEACDKTFVDNQGYGNHLKVHPEIIEKYKNLVLSLFESDLTEEEIIKNNNIPLRSGWIGEIWSETFGKEKVKERISKINSLCMLKQYENGKECWNEGKTAYTDVRIAKSAESMRKNWKNKHIEQGYTVSSKDSMDQHEEYEFSKNKFYVKYINNFKCSKCFKDFSKKLNHLAAHHIIPFRLSRNNFLVNLTPLCISCHNKMEKQLNYIENRCMTLEEKYDLYINGYNDFIKLTNEEFRKKIKTYTFGDKNENVK